MSEFDCHDDDTALPGFRFHPTDEELLTFYLRKKVERRRFPFEIISDVNIYKYDPWDLPKMFPLGEPKRELYFFCPRDRKYRNSARPNRITLSGFWKATGTDRYIYSSSGVCIGLKKSLVFYQGKAASGTKTDWMMHEFRLPAIGEIPSNCIDEVHNLQLEREDANWTICKIFKRQTNPGKIQSPFGHGKAFSHGEETKPCLTDSLATIPVLSEVFFKEDVCEEGSKSLSLSSPTSTPTSDSASVYNASANPWLCAWPSNELAPSVNPSESTSTTPSFQRSSKKLHVSTTSTIFAMTAGEDVGCAVLSPIISPEFCFSGHSCSLFASDQAHQETHSFGQEHFAPIIWSPNSSLSLPLWDSPAFSIDHFCSF